MRKLKIKVLQSLCLRTEALWQIAFCAVWISLLCQGVSFAAPQDNTPWPVPVKTVKIINEDDQGAPLKFPSSVFYDSSMQEIYVVGGGNGRINIYNTDFFPKSSLGEGRGVDSPNGIYVASDGKVFISQGRTEKKPPRITILNAAFFPVKDIYIQQYPGAETFVPNQIVACKEKLYVTGVDFRGLMVLDSEGNFLNWLKPNDKIIQEELKDYSKLPPELSGSLPLNQEGVSALQENVSPAEKELSAEEEQREIEMANLPDYLKPKGKDVSEENMAKRYGPVMVTDVVCGKDGTLYILSEETSKVYVFNDKAEFQSAFGKKGGSSGKLSRPRALAIDEKRKCIYVVDYMRHSILVYNIAGRFLFEIGGKGSPPRWFNFPTDIGLNSEGNLIVADLFNQRVQVLDVEFDAVCLGRGISPENFCRRD